MKKIAAVITALCLLCLAAAAAAETVLTLDDMPAVVIEDENTTVDEAAFQGKWKADKYFVGQTGIEVDGLRVVINGLGIVVGGNMTVAPIIIKVRATGSQSDGL